VETRPKVKKPLSPLDKKLEFAAYILLFVLWIQFIITYYDLPDTIPVHYNSSGVPDDFGKKTMILVLPIIGTILFWLLTYLNKHPRFFNNPNALTEEDATYEYTYATRLIRFYKMASVLIFSLIVLLTYLTAIGKIKGLGVWFLPFIICIMLIPSIYFIIKVLK
jgi:uncharacterized membrane protein